ncbi:MAG TPA: hypothetical protein VIU02_01505 [Burkholderiales bacterium]
MMASAPAAEASSSRRCTHRGHAIETRSSHKGTYWHAILLVRGPKDSTWSQHACQGRYETEDAAHTAATQIGRLLVNFQLDQLF